MISLKVTIPKIETNLQPAITRSLWQSAQLVRRTASQLAPYKTGNLRRSITEFASWNTIEVWSRLVYSAIHEFGGTITPKKWNYLTFKIGNKRVRTKKVNIPARPYLRPGLENNINEIVKIFTQNIQNLI